MKKLFVIVLLLAAIGVGLWATLRRPGTIDALGEWVARQAVAVAEAYIVPDVGFDSFDFQAPATLELRGVTLTAPDSTEVLRADVVRVTLAEVPRLNQPIAIERIELVGATLRLHSTPDGGFKGLVPFVEGQAISSPESVDESLRLSRVMKIRSLSLREGSVEYDDGSGSPPMRLKGLTLDTGVNADADGWYRIDARSSAGGEGLARLAVKGLLNIDSLDTKLDQAALALALDDSTYDALPPGIQQTLRSFDARGGLDIAASGDLPLRDWRHARLAATVTLKDFNIASGEYRLPIDSARWPLVISEGAATMREGVATLLGGEAVVRNMTVSFSDAAMPASLEWDARSIDLQQALRVATPGGEPPKLAGILQTSGNAAAPLAAPMTAIAGRGVLSLREARLVYIPVIHELADTLGVFTELVGVASRESTADAEFDLAPAGVQITKSNVETPALVARGTGTVGYDGRLDLRLNAGPMEKVQGMLGGVGEVLGAITDTLVKYHVGGTVEEPKISVKPLGL